MDIYIAYCINEDLGKIMHAAFTDANLAFDFLETMDDAQKNRWPYRDITHVHLNDTQVICIDDINNDISFIAPKTFRCHKSDGEYYAKTGVVIDDKELEVTGGSPLSIKNQMKKLFTELYDTLPSQSVVLWAAENIRSK